MLIKNYWIIAATFLLVLSIFGCNAEAANDIDEEDNATQGSNANSSEAPDATEGPTPTAVSSGVDPSGQTVVFWHAWDYGSTSDAMADIIEGFNTTNQWGVTVRVEIFDGYQEISDKFSEARFSDESPNLIAGFNYHLIGWDSNEGVLVDLQAYVQDEHVGLSEEDISDFYPVIWEQDVVDNKRLGIAAQQYGQVILYNRSWAEELGFNSLPETPEEFESQACSAAEANGDGTGGLLLGTDGDAMAGWIYAFGGDIEAEDAGYDFDTSETRSAFEFLDNLHAQGCAWEANTLYPNREFANREGLFLVSSIAGLNIQKEYFNSANSEDAWTVIPFPSNSGSATIPVYGVSLAMVSSSPEEQLATWLFLNYFVETANQVKWTMAGGNFPLRISILGFMPEYSDSNPQWTAAIDLLKYGVGAPKLSSWGRVRFVLQDAAKELYRTGESYDPQLLMDLQSAAQEVHAFYRK